MLQTIEEKIKQRRAQMLIHSYLYYELNETVVDDHKWQQWANELVALQEMHPQPIGFYDKEFKDWDASTGFHLPKDIWVRTKAEYVLRISNG